MDINCFFLYPHVPKHDYKSEPTASATTQAVYSKGRGEENWKKVWVMYCTEEIPTYMDFWNYTVGGPSTGWGKFLIPIYTV